MFIVGQGRSGTSVLSNLLDAHPDDCAPKHWELIFPCPPPETATYRTDPRIEHGHQLIDQWNRVTPSITSMHEFAGDMPMECGQILGLGFRSSTWFDSLGQVPSYQMWLAQQDQIEAKAIPADRLYNMLYADLVGDPVGSLADLYAHLGIPLTGDARAALQGYVDAHPREARPKHAVDLGDDELNTRDRQVYRRYQQFFNIPYEK